MSECQPNGNPERGYCLTFFPLPGEFTHDFCGENQIPGAMCPHCRLPLIRILSLDARDPALNVKAERIPFVHLLYCWTCSIPFGEFSYRVNSDSSVELLRVPERYRYEFGPKGPYEGYNGHFPLARVALQPLNDDEVRAARESNDSFDEWHQIGGSPLVSDPNDPKCPSCSTTMPLFAAICNDATGNKPFKKKTSETFAGNGSVQMVFCLCRDCAVVTAYHCCD